MKIFLSPSKSLNYTNKAPIDEYSQPDFIKESSRINAILKKKSVKKLTKLMHISTDLAKLNYERNQKFSFPFSLENAKQAIFAFTGDVYDGFDVLTYPKEKLQKLQDTLCIISGLYGLLKPFDLIMPYRLEMGTKLAIGVKKSLYAFWKPILTKTLLKKVKKDELVVNLASNEYAEAIDFKNISNIVVSPQFKVEKNGEYKTIGFLAKKARGSMARYLCENSISTVEGVLTFSNQGYTYSKTHTRLIDNPVFIK